LGSLLLTFQDEMADCGVLADTLEARINKNAV
jgi:hypothetical protein